MDVQGLCICELEEIGCPRMFNLRVRRGWMVEDFQLDSEERLDAQGLSISEFGRGGCPRVVYLCVRRD